VPSGLDNRRRRFLPRWGNATWSLLVFTVVMALGATVSAVAVTTKENVSAADMRDCTAGFLFSPGLTWEECDDRLHNGDTVITAFIVVWLLILLVFFFVWLKRRA
jgi:amino acid transporter